MKKHTILLFLINLIFGMLHSQELPQNYTPTKQDTLNGSITKERVWWDIQKYEIQIKPDFVNKTLIGKNTIKYKVALREHSELMQVDLVKPLVIDSVLQNNKKLNFENTGNIWYIKVPKKHTSKINELTIFYSGKPTISINPPWDGGFVWAKDSLNRTMVSVACQYKGASIWFPCKNTMYDEPDEGVLVSITVPDTLIAVGNGRLKKQQKNNDKTVTYNWEVVNPISHYAISFYIGHYINSNEIYQGRKGNLTLDYWVLDYNKEKAIKHMLPEVKNTLKSLEKWFGPYPFYEDGFKMVDASYIGMEHQSAIAYGGGYIKGTNRKGMDISKTGWGKKTDRIIVHEMAHEWFGNNITAIDIADRWIQEGFAGLAEELVIADLCGKKAGEEFLAGRFRTIENDKPVIGRYGINEDGSQDNYIKGWAVIHIIKTIINDDEKFLKILHGLNTKFYHQVVTSQQIENFINEKSGINFDAVFDQYLRAAQQPILEYKIKGNTLEYRFTNCNSNFKMPIKTNWTENKIITPTVNWQTIEINKAVLTEQFKIDLNFYLGTKEKE